MGLFVGVQSEEVLEKLVRNVAFSSFLSGSVFSHRLHVYLSHGLLP